MTKAVAARMPSPNRWVACRVAHLDSPGGQILLPVLAVMLTMSLVHQEGGSVAGQALEDLRGWCGSSES